MQYGSFHLGIRSSDSDIDLILLAPNFVSEERDFFGSFYDFLKKNNKVQSIVKITETYIPLIKMKYDGVSVDLIFAQTYYDTVLQISESEILS